MRYRANGRTSAANPAAAVRVERHPAGDRDDVHRGEVGLGPRVPMAHREVRDFVFFLREPQGDVAVPAFRASHGLRVEEVVDEADPHARNLLRPLVGACRLRALTRGPHCRTIRLMTLSNRGWKREPPPASTYKRVKVRKPRPSRAFTPPRVLALIGLLVVLFLMFVPRHVTIGGYHVHPGFAPYLAPYIIG
jgi:hypothetical protein